jgi:hypothetical protein
MIGACIFGYASMLVLGAGLNAPNYVAAYALIYASIILFVLAMQSVTITRRRWK